MLEVKTIEELSYIANKDTGVGLSVVALDWVQDGIEEVEAGAIDRMSNFGDAEVASAVVSLGWVQDGIDDVEVKTIEDVSYIAYETCGGRVIGWVVSLRLGTDEQFSDAEWRPKSSPWAGCRTD